MSLASTPSNPLSSSSTSSTSIYRLSTLISECVGRFIITPKSPALQLSSLINASTYARCWEAFTLWICNQFDTGTSINLSPLGVVSMTETSRFGARTRKVAEFYFLAPYVDAYLLQLKRPELLRESPGSSVHVNYSLLGQTLGLAPTVVRTALGHLFRRLGEVLAIHKEGHRVLIDLGVGSIVASDGVVDFLFHDVASHDGDDNERLIADDDLVVTSSVAAKADRLAEERKPAVNTMRATRPSRDTLSLRKRYPLQSQKQKARAPHPPPGSRSSSRRGRRLVPSLRITTDDAAPQHAPDNFGVLQHSDVLMDRVSGSLSQRQRSNPPSPRPMQPVRDRVNKSKPAGRFAQRRANRLRRGNSTIRNLLAASSTRPPVLDTFARTQAATFDDATVEASVSSRIASFFTPSATTLRLHSRTGRVVYSGAEPFSLLDAAALIARGAERSSQASESSANYAFYVTSGIPDSAIAPINRELLRNSVALVQESRDLLDSRLCNSMLDQMIGEVYDSYALATKKSIMDYVLLNPRERRRMGVTDAPPDAVITPWGQSPVPPPPPPQWRRPIQHAYQSVSDRALLYNDAFLQLFEIWARYEHLSLFHTPTPLEMPMSPHDFEELQTLTINEVREELTKSWSREVELVFQRYTDENDLDEASSARLFSTVAIIMGSQLRSLVVRSTLDMLRFFQSYKDLPDIQFRQLSSKQSITSIDTSQRSLPEPIFLMRVQAATDDNAAAVSATASTGPATRSSSAGSSSRAFSYTVSMSDLVAIVSRVFDRLVSALDSVPRIEAKLFPSLINQLPPINLHITPDSTRIWSRKTDIQELLRDSTRSGKKLLNMFDEYAFLLSESRRVEEFLAQRGNTTLQRYEAEIKKYEQMKSLLRTHTSSNVPVRMCNFRCAEANQFLVDSTDALVKRILDFIADSNRERCLRVSEVYQNAAIALRTNHGKSTDLVRLREELERFQTTTVEALLRDCQTARQHLDFLFAAQHIVDADLLMAMRECWELVAQRHDAVADCAQLIADQQQRLETEAESARDKYQRTLDSLSQQVQAYHTTADRMKTQETLADINKLKDRLAKVQAEIEAFKVEEERLGLPSTEFATLAELESQLEPFDELWNLAFQHKTSMTKWERGKVFEFDAEAIEKSIGEMRRKAFKLSSELRDTAPAPADMAMQICTELDEFKNSTRMPLLRVLCNRGMRSRHWKQISEVMRLKYELRPDDSATLSSMLDLGLGSKIEQLEAISEAASKQFSIEKALNTMQSDWHALAFELLPHRETQTFILQGGPIDEIQTLLDDHLIKTQTMRGSSFAAPFAQRIKDWEAWLSNTVEAIECWLQVQSQWMYLEPVFGAPDIIKQMPTEGALFKRVNERWHQLMGSTSHNPSVEAVMAQEDLVPALKQALVELDKIQTGLNQYLETKRLAFPRFFFLSNDELLEILSETRDPLRVQPHMKKCFDGIRSLDFADNLDILAMISKEGERVPMCRTVNPLNAKGAVESWLRDVEALMFESVQLQCARAIKDHGQAKRTDWVVNWPGQVVLTVNQIFWTRAVEAALASGGGVKELSAFLDKSNRELQEIVMLVRGKLSKLARSTLGALVVIDVHARDVVDSLVRQQVHSASDFQWASQLRYYWADDDVRVRMITSDLKYGYEYIGNSSRLVITPLTDRCYRTLMGAVQLEFGGAPEGPAGTGKTETVKDLAKAIGIQCVVFNCSDGLDYLAMGKFFKGLASSGAWACFDEFNRIDLEVLSVVAQQIHTIVRAKEQKLDSFLFEGTQLSLRRTANVFITMNPGYAGRSELPDNLKALFRTVAMMVPDYGLIAEILLYSFGFVDARNLARKIVATYRLCSEQLSSQDHYDYGMRAVRAVLTAARNLKQAFPDEDEQVLVLRSITDVNLPKFLSHDIPLFEGIVADLFPTVTLPKNEYGELLEVLHAQMKERNLQPEPAFVNKVLQLHEMILVRHGLMVVGQPFAGKTTAQEVLAAALTARAKAQEGKEVGPDDTKFEVVQTVKINPKSMTIGQLYGQFDPVSHEWNDGTLATQFRNFSSATSPDRKWLIFDGPVDAIWIENMNTVLDDNKKLCLMSGEIIQMSDTMNMIFEVADLAVASPATVSRCGMVYMEPEVLGWQPLIKSWLNTLPVGMGKQERGIVETLVEWLVPSCLRHVRSCQVYSPAPDSALVTTLTTIFDSLAHSSALMDAEAMQELGVQAIAMIEGIFLYALIWSIGASVDVEGRASFGAFLREICREVNHYKLHSSSPPPAGGSVFDYVYDVKLHGWASFRSLLDPEFAIAPTAKFQDILVPTVDTARYTFMLEMYIQARKPCLFVGPTGTGKSVYVQNYVQGLSREQFAPALVLNFSARTSANQTQSLIEANLDRRRRGVYGPSGGRRCVVFVDDLNMPQPEEYGAQPPIELLRQLIDQGGWYDTKERSFLEIQDIQVVAAMGPAGGGRAEVTSRLLRHFRQVSVSPFDDAALTKIFSTILQWHFSASASSKGFPPEFSLSLAQPLVDATRRIFKTVSDELLPVPAKSHYTFNLRDFASVVQGLLTAKGGDSLQERDDFVTLWVHEVHRVFGDRLTDDQDRARFLGWVRNVAREELQYDLDKQLAHLDQNDDKVVDRPEEIRGLMFGSYMDPRKRIGSYVELRDMAALDMRWESFLEEYNNISSKPMQLVMFRFAVEHASRIVRILQQPGGNALLVGVGGSGKQSLTRLAAHVVGCSVIQIELSQSYGATEWHDDLKRVLRSSGLAGESTVFLLTDSQIKDESFLEDVNGLLNAGQVPNLWAADELGEMFEVLRKEAKKAHRFEAGSGDPSPTDLMHFFTERVRENLHVVLCMSPIGNTFRDRLRMFPALVNCCTIDWFSEWPHDALESVASQFLSGVPMSSSGKAEDDDALREKCTRMCIHFHKSVEQLSREFLSELGRHCYVTPTSYLTLITTFKALLAEQRQLVSQQRARYQNGLDKLAQASEAVKTMQVELEAMQPQLARTREETEAMIKVVNKETIEANKIREEVKAEEAIAAEAAAKAKAIETDCQEKLDEAMPLLEAALSALDGLSKSELSEVKAMRSPPEPVKLVMEALCIMKGVPPMRVPDPDRPGKKKEDYWEPAKKFILSDPKLLRSLQEFDKDNISPAVVRKIRAYQGKKDFALDKIKTVSTAAYSLASWIYAMEAYDRVAKVIAPKREDLKRAQAEFAVVQHHLEDAQSKLSAVEEKIAGLNEKLSGMREEKAALEANIADCAAKMKRANVLLSGLGGERERWTNEAQRLGEEFVNLTGDVLLSAAMIGYLGPFTDEFRRRCLAKWVAQTRELEIPCGDEFSLTQVLGDPVKIREWVIDGLPNDNFSIDNAVIISKAQRWPLLIDPQGQANQWIKRMERDKQLVVIKQHDDDYSRKLESAIQFGRPCLLEDVGESLDPALEPLLLKQIVKKGGGYVLMLGEDEIEYEMSFRFFITTKLRNPHYMPEASTKVSLLNFMITQSGLEDQLLGIVVKREKPALEEERNQLIVTSADNARKLKEIEDQILRILSESQGSILDDEEAVSVLSKSKRMSNEIAEKQKVQAETEKEIELTRDGYKPVAFHASALFFCVAELANIDPMYQYSLTWFLRLFVRSIAESDPSHDLTVRIDNLNQHFTRSLHGNVCRSLFDKDKLLYSFSLAASLQRAHGEVSDAIWRFLISGSTGPAADTKSPIEWLSDRAYTQLQFVSVLEDAQSGVRRFGGLATHVEENSAAWKKHVFDSAKPHEAKFPGQWQDRMSYFDRLVVLRIMRPDKVIPGVRKYVIESLGPQFVEFASFDLAGSFGDSSSSIPIVFVLSPGSDPMASLLSFAAEQGKDGDIVSVSLGQGQGKLAAAAIREGAADGNWVVLQNAHLCESFMPDLEKICDGLAETERTGGDGATLHRDFRLWITSYPSQSFPVSILQNAVKLTCEAPKGLRASMLSSYSSEPLSDPEFVQGAKKVAALQTLTYSLCFFHALLLERLTFGALGMNIPYGFTDSDLKISLQQLRLFLDESAPGVVPFDALHYLIGEANYGGRVTDDWDRRTLVTLLRKCFSTDVFDGDFSFCGGEDAYTVPPPGAVSSYIEFIRALPMDSPAELFGLHGNAAITKARGDTALLFDTMLKTQSGDGGSSAGASDDETLMKLSGSLLDKLPGEFDLDRILVQYPLSYSECYNTVLVQECERYNKLLVVIRSSLVALQRAIRGEVLMDAKLEAMAQALLINKVPGAWLSSSYPSLKPLNSYFTNLLERLEFFQRWVDRGTPDVLDFDKFYFPHGFLTGTTQNFARKYKIPVDEVEFDFEFMPHVPNKELPAIADGVYVQGMHFEGAAWDHATHSLVESAPKQLFTDAPVVHLKPRRRSEDQEEDMRYVCPLYTTSSRRGTLSTTGHSTNFVMAIKVPSNVDPTTWIERGVALLLQLDD